MQDTVGSHISTIRRAIAKAPEDKDDESLPSIFEHKRVNTKYCNYFLLVLWLIPIQGFSRDSWENVAKIVAVGDLHGDYEQYLQILNDNQLIDTKLNWQGGKTHFVQLGDIPDRGPDSLSQGCSTRLAAHQLGCLGPVCLCERAFIDGAVGVSTDHSVAFDVHISGRDRTASR